MARTHLHYIPGHIWHITHRCHKREFLLKYVKDRHRWLQWLFKAYQMDSIHSGWQRNFFGRGKMDRGLNLVHPAGPTNARLLKIPLSGTRFLFVTPYLRGCPTAARRLPPQAPLPETQLPYRYTLRLNRAGSKTCQAVQPTDMLGSLLRRVPCPAHNLCFKRDFCYAAATQKLLKHSF